MGTYKESGFRCRPRTRHARHAASYTAALRPSAPAPSNPQHLVRRIFCFYNVLLIARAPLSLCSTAVLLLLLYAFADGVADGVVWLAGSVVGRAARAMSMSEAGDAKETYALMRAAAEQHRRQAAQVKIRTHTNTQAERVYDICISYTHSHAC